MIFHSGTERIFEDFGQNVFEVNRNISIKRSDPLCKGEPIAGQMTYGKVASA